MPRCLVSARLAFVCTVLATATLMAEPSYRRFEDSPHDYFRRTPKDRFTQLLGALASGTVTLDRTSELAFLRGLLDHLGIPASSQMLVFSTTSLQLSRISPANPRALYFSEDLYLGYIPGGRLEIIGLDPDLGAIYYIFDLPRGDAPIQVERSTRCMNCHADEDTGHVPGLVVKSVAAGSSGGSLDAFRRGLSGHAVPLAERFGGWYLTGHGAFTNHWGNALGRFVDEALVRIPNPPEARVPWAKYLRPTSDLLPQLLHEHQAGFVNRVVEATYRARTHLATDGPELSPDHAREVDRQAEIIVRYLLFADEAALPEGGVAGDPEFKTDFLRNRRAVEGAALKDFDLRTRLFRYRCSYMVYSPVFAGLPPVVKEPVYRRLRQALALEVGDPAYAYLPPDEKLAIRRILRGTLPDLPAGW